LPTAAIRPQRESRRPFRKTGFRLAAEDVYRCPAGERLTYRFTGNEKGKMMRRYWTTACQGCALKAKCTTGPERRTGS
jgi:hypothetical protein